ncbi:MAG: signal peptidase I [Microthrixaceae bacterium]
MNQRGRRTRGFAVGVLASVVLLASLGLLMSGRVALLSVPTGSMEPAIPTGSLLVAVKGDASSVEVGDVLVFGSPVDDRLIVHRVSAVEDRRGVPLLTTKGDANPSVDPWEIRLDDTSVHHVAGHLPGVGALFARLHEPMERVALLVFGGLLVLGSGLRRIWRPDRRRNRTGCLMPPCEVVGSSHTRSMSSNWAPNRTAAGRKLLLGAVVVAAVTLLPSGSASATFIGLAGSAAEIASGSVAAPFSIDCTWTGATTLSVQWPGSAPGASGYQLLRAADPVATGSVVATVLGNGTSAAAVSVPTPAATIRYHRVRSTRSTWTSSATGPMATDRCHGTIGRRAGTGTAGLSGDGGPAASAQLNAPRHLVVMPDGSTLIADTGNNRIRRLAADGTISTYAGGPAVSPCAYVGPVAGLGLSAPSGLAVTSDGAVIVADSGANCIRRIDTAGTVSRVAGGGATTTCIASGSAAAVSLSSPRGVAVAADDSIVIADTGRNCVRRVTGTAFSHVLGGGTVTACLTSGLSTGASLSSPSDVDVAPDGTVVVADTGRNCVRSVAAGAFSHVLGGGTTTACSATGSTSSISLSAPESVLLDDDRAIVIDRGRRCVRAVAQQQASRVALSGSNAATGDGGPSVGAAMLSPAGVAIAADGGLLVTDRSTAAGGSVVRRVEP